MYIRSFSRQMKVKLNNPYGAVIHFEKFGYVIVKHVQSRILIIHGSEDGTIEKLPRVRQLKLQFDHVVCCYSLVCRRANPELNIIGEFDNRSRLCWDDDSITLYFA